MPSRTLTALIIAGWLAATGWLYVRDLQPRLFPSGPPPFNIDLVDEARTQASTRWLVFRDGEQRGYAETGIRYDNADDTFELRSEFKLWEEGPVQAGQADFTLRSMYRVDRGGSLHALRSFAQKVVSLPGQAPLQVELEIVGAVRDGELMPKLRVSPFLPNFQELPPVKLAGRSGVLNPLQPLSRFPGLRKGQRWRIPLIDPNMSQYLNKVTGGLLSMEMQWLEARVLPVTETLSWHDEEVPCLVIEYSGDETNMKQWIRASDGLMLQQEAELPTFGKLILVRD